MTTVEVETAVMTYRVDVRPRTKRSSNNLVKTAHQLGFTGLEGVLRQSPLLSKRPFIQRQKQKD